MDSRLNDVSKRRSFHGKIQTGIRNLIETEDLWNENHSALLVYMSNHAVRIIHKTGGARDRGELQLHVFAREKCEECLAQYRHFANGDDKKYRGMISEFALWLLTLSLEPVRLEEVNQPPAPAAAG